MQSKIKTGAINEVRFLLIKRLHIYYINTNIPNIARLCVCIHIYIYWVLQYKKEVDVMLQVARSYIKSRTSENAQQSR